MHLLLTSMKSEIPPSLGHKLELMVSEVWWHSDLGNRDVLSLAGMVVAFFIVMYIFYGLFVVQMFEWNNNSVKLSLYVLRNIHPLCATCAGEMQQTVGDLHDFTFFTPLKKPTRVKFLNNFFSESVDLTHMLDNPFAVNYVEIHDCGGIQDMRFELAADRESVRLLFLPSPDYENILLHQQDSYFMDLNKQEAIDLGLAVLREFWYEPWIAQRTVYVARGIIALNRTTRRNSHSRVQSYAHSF